MLRADLQQLEGRTAASQVDIFNHKFIHVDEGAVQAHLLQLGLSGNDDHMVQDFFLKAGSADHKGVRAARQHVEQNIAVLGGQLFLFSFQNLHGCLRKRHVPVLIDHADAQGSGCRVLDQSASGTPKATKND